MKKLYSILTLLTMTLSTSLTAQVNFEPPYNVQASVNGNDVLLNWNAPDTNSSLFLSWDAGITGNSIGLTDSGSFAVAARWDADMLEEYAGYSVTKLAFFMPGQFTDYTAFVGMGPEADSIAFSTVVEETQPDAWTYVYPDSPISLDVLQELWAGYEVSQLATDFGAGCDFGPAEIGYGDMINYEGFWVSMSQALGLEFNFNIRVYLSSDAGEVMLSSNPMTKDKLSVSGFSNFETKTVPIALPNPASKIGSAITGYNVYRNGELITPVPIQDTLLLDPSLSNGVYAYGVSAVYEGGESNPVGVTAQIGNPELVVFPEAVSDTLLPGNFYEEIITIYNEGDVDLYWSAVSTEFWAFMNPPSGILAPGEGTDLQLILYTYNLTAGNYTAEIEFTQNNTQNPVVSLPVDITVIGSPGIAVFPSAIGFGDVVLGNTYTSNLTLSNIGTDTLLLENILVSDPVFELGDYPEALAPFEQTTLLVSLTPEELGELEASLTIFSNDQLNPETVVPLSAFIDLQNPVLLQATVSGNDVTLDWEQAITGSGSWLNWDNGENFTGFGITAGGSFQYAVRWDAIQLGSYDGKLVPKIAFFPRGANTSYTLKIWKGENATQEVVSQEISSFLVNQWNEVFIQEPFVLDGTSDLWLGMEVSHPIDDYPAGAALGPAVGGYGDLINLDGTWVSMLEFYGLDYNWNLQMFVLTEDSTQYEKISPPQQAIKKFYNVGNLIDGKLSEAAEPVFTAMMETGELLGYNVYRDDEQLNEELLVETTYTDTNLNFGLYSYGVTAVYDLGESSPAEINVQVGAPEMTFNPTSISDTLQSAENKDYVVNISNNGNFVLEWNATANVSWLTLETLSGTVEPGEDMELSINLNSAALFGGTYTTDVVFEINNLNNPVQTFPVEMFVEGEALLTLTPDTIDFGVTPLGTFKTSYVTISNLGNDFIYITGMAASPDVFTTQDFPVFLYPGGTLSLGVNFTPDSLGNYEGTFTVFTDDPAFPALQTTLLGSSLLPPPINLIGTTDSLDVSLDWQFPLGSGTNFLQYADEFGFNAIGYPEGGAFLAAAKFGPEELMMVPGSDLTQIGFKPWSATAEFTLKVWLGENAETLILEQAVGDLLPLEWNDFVLDFPISLDTIEYIWIGYEVVHEPGDYPAGTDFGPAVEGKGDLISTDGVSWETLSNWGIPFNWSIRGTVDAGEKSTGPTTYPTLQQELLSNSGQLKSAINPGQASYKESTASFNFLGYKVYRNGVLLNDSVLLSSSEYQDTGLEPGTYEYEVTAQYDLGESAAAGPLQIILEEPVAAPEGWDHHHTTMSHAVHIPVQAATENSFMSPGDWIGAFYNDEGTMKSGGSLMWTESDSLLLILYGDNPATPEKEGFAPGEWLHWKVYMNQTGEAFDISVEYNSDMPHFDGIFHMFGMSALTSMQLTTTGMDKLNAGTAQVYPNPTSGRFTIAGLVSIDRIRLIDTMGNEVLARDTSNLDTVIVDEDMTPGIYYLHFQGMGNSFIKKIVVQ